MFDVGFFELTVVGILGLIILGPQRLSVVMHLLGLWRRRLRFWAQSWQEEMANTLPADAFNLDLPDPLSDAATENNKAKDKSPTHTNDS